MNVFKVIGLAGIVVPGLLMAQTWTYTPPAYPGVCTNPAVVGEWTMDYETAVQRAAAEGRNLYLLFTGSTWCPDCDTLQNQVMSTPAMQTFMRESDAYWVWLDFPSRRATNAVERGWLCHTNTGLFTLEQSEAILARNRQLEYIYGSIKNYRAAPGTLNMPTFVICHPDGSYQGEVTHYRTWTYVTPDLFLWKIRRIWNDDPWDVQDNGVPGLSDDAPETATPITDMSVDKQVQVRTLSPTDGADWFAFTAVPGFTYAFALEGQLLGGQGDLPVGLIGLDVYVGTDLTEAVASSSGLLGRRQIVTWTFDGTEPCAVSLRVSGSFGEVTGYTLSYRQVAVAAPTARAIRRTEGVFYDEAGTARVAGLISLSVSRSGFLSAKYRSPDATVSFSARKFWNGVDKNGAVLSSISQGVYRLDVRLPGTGDIFVTLTDPAFEAPLNAVLREVTDVDPHWADAYQGYYTMVLEPMLTEGPSAPMGYSFLTCRVRPSAARSGKTNYSGRFADGKSFSGSAVFRLGDSCSAEMIVLLSNRRYRMAGALSICADAEEARWTDPSVVTVVHGTQMFWAHTTGSPDTSFDITVSLAGGYYDMRDSLTDYLTLYPGEGAVCLLGPSMLPFSEFYGFAQQQLDLTMDVTPTTMRLAKGQTNPMRARFSLNKRTGIFSGSFRMPVESAIGAITTVPVRFAGVLLPGWIGGSGGCDDGCGPPTQNTTPYKPFGMGTLWFKDKATSEQTGRLIAVTTSYPLTIEELAN